MSKIWINGKFYSRPEALVSVEMAALHYGVAAFEGILAIVPGKKDKEIIIFEAQSHLERLKQSAEIIGLKLPYSSEQIIQAIKSLLKENGHRSCYVRPLVYSVGNFASLTSKNFSASLAIMCQPFNLALFRLKMRLPISLSIVEEIINPFKGQYANAKLSGRYLINLLAKRCAEVKGFNDAILLDNLGNITEASTANIFIIQKDTVITPPLGNIIAGITRKKVIDLLMEMGIKIIQRQCSREDVYQSEGVFITGSAIGIVKVKQVDNQKFSHQQKIISQLQSSYIEKISN